MQDSQPGENKSHMHVCLRYTRESLFKVARNGLQGLTPHSYRCGPQQKVSTAFNDHALCIYTLPSKAC